jgi:SAM-dependent methyltransferase
MQESTKTRQVRGPQFNEIYFSGSVLDIGCGHDLVVPQAQPFDKEQGNANKILDYLSPASFDTVHSSHCLEHMFDPRQALEDWWQLVRPGGYLITVVPEEDLYEQGQWPSRFNSDHKATFRLRRATTWSPCSHDLYELHSSLPGARIVSAEVHDRGYNYQLQRPGPESPSSRQLRERLRQLLVQLSSDRLLTSYQMVDELIACFARLGATVDQTWGSALAQIQVIAVKQS